MRIREFAETYRCCSVIHLLPTLLLLSWTLSVNDRRCLEQTRCRMPLRGLVEHSWERMICVPYRLYLNRRWSLPGDARVHKSDVSLVHSLERFRDRFLPSLAKGHRICRNHM
ncbi:unnamed protein product, partial [Citrullus colocynthis]